MLYSKQLFDKLTVENILDLIDLHLANNHIPYDYVEPTIQSIFDNINSSGQLDDEIFDHVFSFSNKNIMLGLFVQMNDSKKLSEYKFNQLIDYLIDNLQDKTKEFFGSILRKTN